MNEHQRYELNRLNVALSNVQRELDDIGVRLRRVDTLGQTDSQTDSAERGAAKWPSRHNGGPAGC